MILNWQILFWIVGDGVSGVLQFAVAVTQDGVLDFLSLIFCGRSLARRFFLFLLCDHSLDP